jgi:hypothetical protein
MTNDRRYVINTKICCEELKLIEIWLQWIEDREARPGLVARGLCAYSLAIAPNGKRLLYCR